MQTGARRATSATGAKTSKGKNGEVIVEKVMTSDSFLSREIKKAPLIEHDGSLVADISHTPNDLKITIQGAREHNLKNVDLAIPRNRMVVFTGLSGSGKSSLAFDTLFAEGQRRYVESLSAYARQFLGQMDKPDVDFIEGLSPAVSIDQKTTNRNPRSTVGTITEIYDYLRLLFARTGIPHCPECGEPVASQTPQQIVDTLLGYPERTRFQILAPVVKGRKGEFVDMIELLRSDGYARALIDGEMTQLSDDIKLTKQKKHTIEVVVDRLVVKDGIRQRLTDSVETALKLANGSIIIDFVDEEEGSPVRRQPFSEHRSCPNGHTLELDEVEPRTFSFNAPYGACPACTGLGFKLEIDPDLIISDPDRSLADGVIEPWSGTKMTSQYYGHILEGLAKEMGFSMKTPWKGLPDDVKHDILYGHDFKVNVSYRNRWGRLREYSTGFEGVIRTLMRRHDETDSQSMREYYESYMREVPCQVCHGRRLKPEVLAVTVDGKSIFDVCDMPVVRELAWINGLKLEGSAQLIAGEVLKEIKARLGFLNDVGLDYLTLSRAAATLSGGEAQRIRLATQIGSGLVGVMYVLDEPSIGLHQRDNERLIETLHHLRDLGNTLIVVEHDEDTIRRADWVVDIGPGAGERGGEVIYSGPAKHLIEAKRSITGDYIAHRREIAVPAKRRKKLLDASTWLRDKALMVVAQRVQKALGSAVFDDHNEFRTRFDTALKAQGDKLSAPEKKAIYKAVSWRDETAPPVIAKRSKLKASDFFEPGFDGAYLETVGKDRFMVEYEPDSELRDTEQVPLKESGGIDAFFEREVLPHVPDAWIATDKTQIGYEISFARYFYKPTPLRTLAEIRADILALEQQSEGLLHKIVGVEK